MDAIYPMRINKYLGSQNYCSRREADGLIEAGIMNIGLKDLKSNQYREIKGKELETFLSGLGL